jgi:hypothetical protein
MVVLNPKCKLKVNGAGSASFSILNTHPNYHHLRKLRSIFEILQDGDVIFRGRMTGDGKNIRNQLSVSLEGVLTFLNDSNIPPFRFPEDFPESAEATNMVEYFLDWCLNQHNSQVTEWQKLKLGTVTVSDPNNYISRASETYMTTWDVLKTRLFESALGGYLCIRYEDDGNYIDYLADFPLTNTQKVRFGENLLDLTSDTDATDTYSAILPMGKDKLTLAELEDGALSDDLVKAGVYIYSKSAVEAYGWRCVPMSESIWQDVTLAENLLKNGKDCLSGKASKLSNTIKVKAVNLHFTDAQIQSFRIYRNVLVDSPVHGVTDAKYKLMELDIDLVNSQNTTITVGDTVRTLIDSSNQQYSSTIDRIQNAEKDISENRTEVSEVRDQLLIQTTQIINDCQQIIMSALESYVETSNYEEFRQTVESQLLILADRITMDFSSTMEHIVNINGDLQAVIDSLEKHFEFGVDGLTIKAGENTMQLLLDNDMIKFTKNGQEFGWWDGVDFHTGNIVIDVNERAQFGNFAFVPRSNGSLSFLKVGG